MALQKGNKVSCEYCPVRLICKVKGQPYTIECLKLLQTVIITYNQQLIGVNKKWINSY